jgi:hypothetical protein
MFVFHADGTMLQSNPPAGNTDTSDTIGMGVWKADENKISAKFEEFRFDLKTGEITRGVVTFNLLLAGDRLTGAYTFSVCKTDDGTQLGGPRQGEVSAERVVL